MKVLQINSVYAKGSTGNIVLDLHRYYQVQGIDSYVIYGRGQKPIESNVFKTCSELESRLHHFVANIFDNVYGGCFFGTLNLINQIKRIKPDIVHIHCINGYFVNIYKLFKFLYKKKIRTIITNHAEFFYTGNCGYSFECNKWMTCCGKCPGINEFNGRYSLDFTRKNFLKMKKTFDRFSKKQITISSVSPWVLSRSKSSPILGSFRNVCVLNGLNTKNFQCFDKNSTRKELGLPIKKNIFSFICSNWNESSKRDFLFSLIHRFNDSLFLVIGAPKDANFPSNVVNYGYVNDRVLLNKILSCSNKYISLSKRETFSLPIAEALCSGTSVVGFYSGGPESICLDKYCKFCEYGDLDTLVKLINEENNYDRTLISKEAKEKYSLEKMADSYISLYKELLNE